MQGDKEVKEARGKGNGGRYGKVVGECVGRMKDAREGMREGGGRMQEGECVKEDEGCKRGNA